LNTTRRNRKKHERRRKSINVKVTGLYRAACQHKILNYTAKVYQMYYKPAILRNYACELLYYDNMSRTMKPIITVYAT